MKPHLMGCILCTVFTMTACIQPEAPNAEAAIDGCIVQGDVLSDEPTFNGNDIELKLKPTADITKLTINFTLPDKATIEPANGSTLDYSDPQTFTVTSEDHKWKRTYTVSCQITGMRTKYDFEICAPYSNTSPYHIIYNALDDKGKPTDAWASGNRGYNMIPGIVKEADKYPTSGLVEGYSGYGVKLQTLNTGDYGMNLKAPIAAGNLYRGRFTLNLANPVEGTQFGEAFDKIPTYITGYYKYKAGEIYQDYKDGALVDAPDKQDTFDVYGIFYEVEKSSDYLTGSNAFTSEKLISVARLEDKDKRETDTWTFFRIPFRYQNDKTIESIDPEKLANKMYKVSLVFTSSKDGAAFSGAVGSTLYIDEVELIYKD